MKHLVAAFLGLGLLIAAGPAPAAPPSRDGYAEVPGGRLYFQECGAGKALILLHDGLLDSSVWDEIWPELCARYHVVRYDRRGYGRSPAASAPFSPEGDLEAVMRQVGMAKAAVVGSSSGSALALDFGIAQPKMVEALVLVGPVVHGMRSSDYFNARGAAANAPLAKGDVRAAAENWSKDRFQIGGDRPDARRRVLEILLASPHNLSVPGGYEIRPAPPSVTRLSEIKAPTLVIAGGDDIADVHAFAGAIQAAVPVVRREVWDGDGHLVQLEKPQDLAHRIEDFLEVAERPIVETPAARLRRFEGSYSVGGSAAKVASVSGHLVFRINGDQDVPLFAETPQRFLVRTTGTTVEFEMDAKGHASAMLIRNRGAEPVRCPRIG